MAKNSSEITPESEGACAILEVAVRLFAEKSFDAVSMNDIAKAAGVSKANVFHHFGTKCELYLAALRIACDDSSQVIAETAKADGPFEQRLKDFLHNHLKSMLENEQATRLVLRELIEHGAEHGKELAEQVFGEHFSGLVTIVTEGQKLGVLKKAIDPALLALMLVSNNIFFFQTQQVMRHFPGVSFADDPAAYSHQVIEVLLHGIKDE